MAKWEASDQIVLGWTGNSEVITNEGGIPMPMNTVPLSGDAILSYSLIAAKVCTLIPTPPLAATAVPIVPAEKQKGRKQDRIITKRKRKWHDSVPLGPLRSDLMSGEQWWALVSFAKGCAGVVSLGVCKFRSNGFEN